MKTGRGKVVKIYKNHIFLSILLVFFFLRNKNNNEKIEYKLQNYVYRHVALAKEFSFYNLWKCPKSEMKNVLFTRIFGLKHIKVKIYNNKKVNN